MQTTISPSWCSGWPQPLSAPPRLAGPLRAVLASGANRIASPLCTANAAPPRYVSPASSSTPRAKRGTVHLRQDNFAVVCAAADDERIRDYIGGTELRCCAQANQELLVTALKNHGVVSDGQHGVRLSLEPAHNRFVREANALEAAHVEQRAQLEAAHAEQLTQLNAQVAGLRTQLSAATAACEIAIVRAQEQERARQVELSKRWPTAAREAEQRATKAEGELASSTTRAAAAERALKKADSACKSACAEREAAQGALRAAMQRREHDDAPALQREVLLTEQSAAIVTLMAEHKKLEKRAAVAEREVQGARISGVMAFTRMKELQAQLAQVTAPPTGRERTRARVLAGKQAELDAARSAYAEIHVKLEALREAATLQRMRSAAEAPPLMQLRVRDADTSALLPRTREFQRAMVDEANGSLEGAATQFSLAYQLLYGVPPPPHLSFSSKSFKKSFDVLGVVDERVEAAVSRAAAAPWAFGADGGNKGNRPMNMVAVSEWSWALGKPLASPLACGDLHKDQSAKNCAAICERAFERAGKLPALCCAGVSDGADAATQEIGGALDGQHVKSGAAGLRLSFQEYCCIHGIALEENAGLDAVATAMGRKPGMLVDGLRILWEVVAGPDSQPNFYRQVWCVDCGLPLLQFEVLAKMAEPTQSKWQIMFEICSKLLPLFEPIADPTIPAALMASPLEKFFATLRKLFQGSTDALKATRAVHTHKDKILLLSGLISEFCIQANMTILVDVWEGVYSNFYKFCKSPSRYGQFEQPHLRHMMAAEVAKVTIFYTKAHSEPKKHLPRLYKLIGSSCRRAFAEQLDETRRCCFAKAGTAFLEKAAEKHAKWNGSTWMRARHLLGLLCDEQRRAAFATELLELMGAGAELEQWRADNGAVRAAPSDDVGKLLHDRLCAAHKDGSLGRELGMWGLRTDPLVRELLLLATADERQTDIDPLLNAKETPRLFQKCISMLFVGFAHNLLLESYVSRLAQLEKIHPGMHALTVDKIFMYRARQTRGRALRLDASVRAVRGGGLRRASVAAALKGSQLKGSACRSKAQQRMMCEQAEARGRRYAEACISKRGSGSIAAQLRCERDRHDAEAARVAHVKLESLRTSCTVTPTGRARKLPLTAIACRAALPALTPGVEQKTSRGNQFKVVEIIRAGLKGVSERAKDQALVAVQLARKGPASKRARIAAERLPAGVARGGRETKRTKRAAAEVAAGAYAGNDDDDDDEYGAQVAEELAGEQELQSDFEGVEDCEEPTAPAPAAQPAAARVAVATVATPAGSAASRAAGGAPVSREEEMQYSHLRKTITVWDARFVSENKRTATTSDLPFHIVDARREYAELKAVFKARAKL